MNRLAGPFQKELLPEAHINRFGVIPTKHQPGKWRLIVDLSHPSGHSVNDGIPKPLCSLTYIAVDLCICRPQVYLSAVRHMHIVAGLHELFSKQLTPRLQLALRGIKKSQASSPRIRLPITLHLLQSIKQVLSSQPQSYKNIMLWAACCLAFFGFLRVSEFTTPNLTDYDPSVHLSLQDVYIDNRENPRVMLCCSCCEYKRYSLRLTQLTD